MPRLSTLLLLLCSFATAAVTGQSIPLAPVVTSSTAQAPEPGITQTLAQARAARLSQLHYTLTYTLVPKAPTTAGSETLTFTDTTTGDLPIDFRDGTLLTATLNNAAIPTTLINGHLILPAAALHRGPNTLITTFTANIAPAGKAITRYLDQDDGNEYLYTLFVPMDADMAFPCFDQPDLKATFSLSITVPNNWQVIANAPGVEALRKESSRLGGPAFYDFPETRPISTYLFAFAAGPFASIPGKTPGEPTLYVRQSQLAKAKLEAPEVQQITQQGVAWLSDYFAQPFPFPKYDLVLIPGFPFGGMEHAGATFLNEDGVLFRSTPTVSDYFKRDILVLHETTHQWFGDLVTMRWFDDLWLKEGFAQYMAYKAMADLKPETNPWKHFNEDIKPLAYAIDETQGTTPIFQQIPNLKDAKSAYGAIVYQKAPAILKQLNFKLGDTIFRDGLRLYLKQHAYANATWQNLIHAFEQAGVKDLNTWADAWITHRGMPQIDTAFTCDHGKLTALTLVQHDILPDNYTWPIANEVLLSAPGAEAHIRIDWSTPSTQVQQAIGKPCPKFIFANSGDQAYGRFLLDPTSQTAVVRTLSSDPAANPGAPGLASETWVSGPPQDPLLSTQLWTALWENVRRAKTPPLTYVELARPALFVEQDESLLRIHGARIATAFHFYMTPQTKAVPVQRIEGTLMTRMSLKGSPENRGTPGIRITAFRAFTTIAETPRGLQVLKDLLAGTTSIEDLTLQPLDRWNLISHLLQQNDPEAQTLYAAELKRDHTGEAQKYAYAAQAAIPNATTKDQYFADYTSTKIQEDWLTQSLRPFNSYNQQPLTLPYLKQSLDLLPEIKRTRKIFFLGAWLSAVLDGQSTPTAQAIVNQWLAQPGIDPDLRLKVLENKDALDRTVLIRRTYPN